MQPERAFTRHPFEFAARPVRLALRDRRKIHFRYLKEMTSERVVRSFIIVLYESCGCSLTMELHSISASSGWKRS